MATIFPFDEVNALRVNVTRMFANGKRPDKKEEEDILDEILDLLLLSYALGVNVTNASLSSDWEPTIVEIMETVDERVAGKTWRERVEEYFANGGSADEIVRVAETEAHRISNTAALKAATIGGATEKTWMTMLDDKVRDQHILLEGQTVPIDALFYTWDGDSAPAPGLFDNPENNVNCRCELMFS